MEEKNKTKTEGNNSEIIIKLYNSDAYSLQSVYIVCRQEGCRLVVLNSNRLLLDRTFNDVKNAKRAFCKEYGGEQIDVMPIFT
ncbi:MAG: hypothetical protein GY765_05445 [bacterium]|nr:hypothetical protein [bacterium]